MAWLLLPGAPLARRTTASWVCSASRERGAAMATDARKLKRSESGKALKRRVVAVGKWTGDRWLVRTSMWRYLTTYVISKS